MWLDKKRFVIIHPCKMAEGLTHTPKHNDLTLSYRSLTASDPRSRLPLWRDQWRQTWSSKRWWRQTWDTCLSRTVVSQSEVRICAGHVIKYKNSQMDLCKNVILTWFSFAWSSFENVFKVCFVGVPPVMGRLMAQCCLWYPASPTL